MEEFDFTNEEKDRINQLYGNDFKGITPDDAQLIARFEQFKAVQNAKFKAESEAIAAQAQANLENANRIAETALANLNELHERAIARLDRFENRERNRHEQ